MPVCSCALQVMFGLAKDDLLELRDEIKGYQVGMSWGLVGCNGCLS